MTTWQMIPHCYGEYCFTWLGVLMIIALIVGTLGILFYVIPFFIKDKQLPQEQTK